MNRKKKLQPGDLVRYKRMPKKMFPSSLENELGIVIRSFYRVNNQYKEMYGVAKRDRWCEVYWIESCGESNVGIDEEYYLERIN